MIVSLDLKYFRKHEDLRIDFVRGLNVLRGPNEVGKTTVTEGILYALFGSKALIDPLSEVVTWGQKESALKSKLVLSIGGVAYTFARSKAGAECTYPMKADNGSVTDVRVTGQAEVTAFASTLLGADAKTASLLMLSSQAGLRGALDDGPSAVSTLMGKLADFDMIDRLLQSAQEKLALGAEAPLQAKLDAADTEVLEATRALPDPAALEAITASAAALAAQAKEIDDAIVAFEGVMVSANAAVSEGRQREQTRHSISTSILSFEEKLKVQRSNLASATADAAKRSDGTRVAALRAMLAGEQENLRRLHAYAKFTALPVYPTVFWDEPVESFNAAEIETMDTVESGQRRMQEIAGEVRGLRTRLITSGRCPTCGSTKVSDEHVAANNEAVNREISALNAKSATEQTYLTQAQATLASLRAIRKTPYAVSLEVTLPHIAQYVSVDKNNYPPHMTWLGDVPTAHLDVAKVNAEIALIEASDRQASVAEGRVATINHNIAEFEGDVARLQKTLVDLPAIEMKPLTVAYDQAYAAYAAQSAKSREARNAADALTQQKIEIERTSVDAQRRLTDAQARVVEYAADLKTLSFNNCLVKKLKTFKPLITDHLWNSVLAAVSNFFSTLRGEQSVVTKDASGFKVNGRGGSLSGSTLDVLALAIRVALSKTFVPHASFMVLDEPAHGCDVERTGNLLGFLSSVGFDQTILASHDELSEAVADNVIHLGE